MAESESARDFAKLLTPQTSGNHADVSNIQPRLNLVKRYVQMRGAMDEATLYAVLFERVFRRG